MGLTVVTVDLETFWDSDHSLSKMDALTYAMHPRTEIISCACKIGSAPTTVAFGEAAVAELLATVNWSNAILVGHNMSEFDAIILAWRLGVRPALWACTLAMARPKHAKTTGLSLGALVAYYGIGVKDATVLIQTKGKRLSEFTAEELHNMRVYNAHDVDQCYELFKILVRETPAIEMRLLDMTIRMLIDTKFFADVPLLQRTLEEEQRRKTAAMAEAAQVVAIALNRPLSILPGRDPATEVKALLSSSPKCAKVLTSLGVEVPMKISARTGKEIPALAKNDTGFLELLDHPNPMVAAIASARMDAKSTILETRIQAFLSAARNHPAGMLPVPLKYYGADTTGRWSGWLYNPQNLPRINDKNPQLTDALRNSIVAPKGHVIVVADQSGIELRVNHFLWKVPYSTAMYEADPEGADLYKDFASKLYHTPVQSVSKPQRQVGKVAHLGLGFGAGASTFQTVAKTMGGVELSGEESQSVVDTWRAEHREITAGWRKCHRMLDLIIAGVEGVEVDPWGLVTTHPEGLRTPSGLIRYPKLRKEFSDEEPRGEYFYAEGRHKARIYAGKIDENIVQHLARNVLAWNAITVADRTGMLPAHMVHDELVYVVPERDADAVLAEVLGAMATPPPWWPELITRGAGGVSYTYGAAK